MFVVPAFQKLKQEKYEFEVSLGLPKTLAADAEMQLSCLVCTKPSPALRKPVCIPILKMLQQEDQKFNVLPSYIVRPNWAL